MLLGRDSDKVKIENHQLLGKDLTVVKREILPNRYLIEIMSRNKIRVLLKGE